MLNTAGRSVKPTLILGLVFRSPPKWHGLIWPYGCYFSELYPGSSRKNGQAKKTLKSLTFHLTLVSLVCWFWVMRSPIFFYFFQSRVSQYWNEVMVNSTDKSIFGELRTYVTKMATSCWRRLTKTWGQCFWQDHNPVCESVCRPGAYRERPDHRIRQPSQRWSQSAAPVGSEHSPLPLLTFSCQPCCRCEASRALPQQWLNPGLAWRAAIADILIYLQRALPACVASPLEEIATQSQTGHPSLAPTSDLDSGMRSVSLTWGMFAE